MHEARIVQQSLTAETPPWCVIEKSILIWKHELRCVQELHNWQDAGVSLPRFLEDPYWAGVIIRESSPLEISYINRYVFQIHSSQQVANYRFECQPMPRPKLHEEEYDYQIGIERR